VPTQLERCSGFAMIQEHLFLPCRTKILQVYFNMNKPKKIKLAGSTWEMIRIKSDTKRAIALLKADLGYLTFDEVLKEALVCYKNNQGIK